MPGTLDNVISGIKTVRDIAKRIENAELLTQIAELMMSSADLKTEIAEIKEENTTLKRGVDLRSKIEVKMNVLYLTEDVAGYNRGPFCPICFEKESYLINIWTGPASWSCKNCQKSGIRR